MQDENTICTTKNMIHSITIKKHQNGTIQEVEDWLAVEEPLEMRLLHRGVGRPLSVTMRTPGQDEDLVTGFLFTEGIIRRASDLLSVSTVGENMVQATLSPELNFQAESLNRHFYTTSSCGVCGKTSIDAIKTAADCPINPTLPPAVRPEIITALPGQLRQVQSAFDATGGIHAAALFDREGMLLGFREDVGRHNALDKLIGHFFTSTSFPLENQVLLLSGRASFELIQKAAMAGIRVVVAVGAPSSLAVETARMFKMRLLGFVRDGRFNEY